MQWFSSFILRRAGVISFIGTLLAIVGAYFTILLYKNLRTDLHELLPNTARSVLDLNEVSRRLESIDSLAVLIFSDHPRASKRFVMDLVKKLEEVPKETISSIDYKIDRELQFFKQRQALYLELPDLIRIRNYIRDRIDYEKELYNPLNIFRADELPEPHFNILALKHKYVDKLSNYDRFPGGFYATPDEKIRVVLVNRPGHSSGTEGANRLKAAVDQTLIELQPKTYAPDLDVKYTGTVAENIEEQAALVADLELSTAIVTIIVSFGMLAFYRTARATAALVISLFMGTFWTFGISYFLVGYLNANSAFLGSIVIGNGMNFGIIFLARYLEERRRNKGNIRSVYTSMVHTANSTLTAALAAGLSYGSLILTGFRGFKQFGIIGLIGMILCWVSAYTLLPAYLTLLDRMRPLVKPGSVAPKAYIAGTLAKLVGHFPKVIWGTSLLITLISVLSLTRINRGILETDLAKLRNKESMEHGSAYLSKYLDDIFQHFLSPLAILPSSRENAKKIAAILKEKKEKEGKDSLLAVVQTLDDFLPKDQPKKIEILKEIHKLLPAKLVRRLSETDQHTVARFLNREALVPIYQKDLPPLVLSKFTEKDGSIGKMVLVEPPLTNETRQADNLIKFVDELRSAADSIEPGTPVAGMMAVSSDMIRAISLDGPKATLFAFLAVVILVVLLFRNVETILLILFSLILGVLWLAGIILIFDLKINFLNFIALPITFGIGVDYGVNIFQRYRETKKRNILKVIKSTGSAVGLCSFSTIVGYTSLLLAGNQGFVSFGMLAVAGELTCVIAAILSLPAYLAVRDHSKMPRERVSKGKS